MQPDLLSPAAFTCAPSRSIHLCVPSIGRPCDRAFGARQAAPGRRFSHPAGINQEHARGSCFRHYPGSLLNNVSEQQGPATIAAAQLQLKIDRLPANSAATRRSDGCLTGTRSTPLSDLDNLRTRSDNGTDNAKSLPPFT